MLSYERLTMIDDPGNFVLEHLRSIRADMGGVRDDMW